MNFESVEIKQNSLSEYISQMWDIQATINSMMKEIVAEFDDCLMEFDDVVLTHIDQKDESKLITIRKAKIVNGRLLFYDVDDNAYELEDFQSSELIAIAESIASW